MAREGRDGVVVVWSENTGGKGNWDLYGDDGRRSTARGPGRPGG
ncbi:MAG: hypothetical protein WKF75_03670 [Singulisphaera sp.]